MKILIIGGVAAGASAGARARRLDESAEIIIFERGEHVSFANCGLPYHIGGTIKERERLLLQTPESLKRMLNLDVRTGHEVVGIDRENRNVTVKDLKAGTEYKESYDKLVLAPGASPLLPPLPGIDNPNIYTLRNVGDMDQIKAAVDGGAGSAVVIGGGYIGVEMAEALQERGLTVNIVEMVDQLMPPLDKEIASFIEDHMESKGVGLNLGAAAAAFTADGEKVRVELKSGDLISADLVIMAAGVRPESALAEMAGLEVGERGGIKVNNRMQTSDPDIYAAGDAVEVTDTVTGLSAQIPLAGPANRQGRIAADNICGRDSLYTTTQGTAIVKVFDMTAGGTGASEKSLKRAGMEYEKIYLHPAGHAGYYPGTSPMHIKVLFSKRDGVLFGAQIAGYDGVDKRLDVFATAIRAKMTIHELENLELSYAPPYGSAKDPVNMAGFIGSNLLNGDIGFWYPEDFPSLTDDGVIVDVRGAQEYEPWHIPGAVNIPLGRLRASLDQLPKDKKIYVYCKVGFRSYLAYRLLVQSGFDAVTLAGGSLSFRAMHRNAVEGEETREPDISYAEDKTSAIPASSGNRVEIDCTGLQCPGPLRRMADSVAELGVGDELVVTASDPGFAADAAAWCKSRGHLLVEAGTDKGTVTAVIRKSVSAPSVRDSRGSVDKKTMVVFSGDLDKVMASFIIANGAVSMGSEVTMFFTFWGLNSLRKKPAPKVKKGLLDKMFGAMMPCGAESLTLSKMNMMGMGTEMMKYVMKSKNVDSLPVLIKQAQMNGVRFVACTMSMDVMGITMDELIDGVEVGGVATFLGESEDAGMSLFI